MGSTCFRHYEFSFHRNLCWPLCYFKNKFLSTLIIYIYSYIFVFIENPPFLGLILEKEYIFSVAVHYTLLLHNTISEAVIWILDVSNKLLEGIVQILPCAQLETKLILVFCTISVLICGITCMKGISMLGL